MSAILNELPKAADTAPSQPRGGPMSVGRVLGILELLATNTHGLSLAEISRRLKAPKASVLGLLRELMALQYVRKNERGQFELASLSYRLAVGISATGSLHRMVGNTLIELSSELHMTVVMAYLDHERHVLVYADRCETNSAVRYVIKLGDRLDIHTRSTGKLLLANEPEADWPLWLGAEPYQKFTKHTRTRLADISQDLRRARKETFAWSHSEQYDGISGVAYPIRDAHGNMAAAIALQGLSEWMKNNKDRIEGRLKAACDAVSNELALRQIEARSLPKFI
jgi:DNA-binding IclR family transcriptional regulator